jgi:peptidyl-prolyl cis-trans isomerase SurA
MSMSSRSKRQVLAVVVAAVAAFTLSGCAGASPGVAVSIGDQTLSTSEVDDLTVAYCEGLEPQFEANGAVFPMNFVRAYVVRNLTVKAAAEQLAEHYSVELPPSYDQAVRDLRDQLAGFKEDRIDQVLEVESVGPYVPAVEIEVGGRLLVDEGTAGADDAAQQARGEDALVQWMAEHPADVNPRYGIAISNADLDAPRFVDTGTSYALSPRAADAAKSEPDQDYAATLPSSQRCG